MSNFREPAKVKNVERVRHFLTDNAVVMESEQTLSTSQSLYPIGSQIAYSTLLFRAKDLSPTAIAWIESHDQFRIDEVEVFATLTSRTRGNAVTSNIPVEVYCYEATDADPATVTSWIRTQNRTNLSKNVLTALNPSVRLARFKPTITLAANASSQNAQNIIPRKGTMIDALATDQWFSGLRIFSACPQTDSSGQSYDYQISLSRRYKIVAKQPI